VSDKGSEWQLQDSLATISYQTRDVRERNTS